MNYIIHFLQEPKKALLANRQHSFLQMQWMSQHLWERYSLKPWPPDISLSWQLTVMSTLVPATPEHASLAQCRDWVSLPRRACLEAICFGGHWGLSRQLEQKFFLRHVQSSHRSCLCMRKTVRSNRTRKSLPYELYNNLFSKTKEGIVGKPSTFFLAVFCLMQWLSQHLRKRCSLKPCPPDFSLVFEMVPATPEHASLTQCPERISFPRRACLEAVCLWRHWGLSRQLEQKFFLEAHAIKSPFLPVRAKDSPNNSNKERLAMGTI